MSGRPLSFKNSKFFIVKPRYYCCGGDIVENDGTCGESIYGADFKSEKRNNFIGRGDLAMGCIDGVHSSQFFITFGNNFGLDGKYPVFGRVVKGWDVLAKIEAAADGDVCLIGGGGVASLSSILVLDCLYSVSIYRWYGVNKYIAPGQVTIYGSTPVKYY
ncbi:hypothetical protein Tsubulata_049182 [Turnera subulata]|uniref:Peptidyl-prolyl cis-trans isomerase n=1 Tax=Turnera subulata TaxID=218843 RepID=A0A9Q0JEC6_9ROSI|nr:hypothetical protein Tsubulata_049182 [Turnera subulata]